jgi:hypothetical protein
MQFRPIFVSILLTLMMAAALPSFAAEKNLLLGTWTVDVSKLNQSDPPASVTMVFAESGVDSYKLTFDIATRDGKSVQVGGDFKPDGSLITASASAELDVATFAMPNRRTLVMGAALNNHPTHTRVWTLSDDGTYMTEIIVGHIDGKTPHIRTAIWRRAKRD